MLFIVNVIHTLIALYSLALVARSFLGMLLGSYHPVIVFLRRITEPVLAPLRRYIPPIQSGGAYWDITPMVAILILWAVEQIITRILLALV
ncbi:MAG: YggT family protein [Anaerolineae bacterium]|nr:YggT family protein [Anaerolineae bacterium]